MKDSDFNNLVASIKEKLHKTQRFRWGLISEDILPITRICLALSGEEVL